MSTSDRTVRLLASLKNYAHDGGREPVAMASLYAIADDCVELQQARFKAHGIMFELDIEACIPDFLCRDVQIRQVITNLLDNAFESVVRSEGTVRWVVLGAGYAQAEIHIEVTRSSPFLQDQIKARITEPFFTTEELCLESDAGLNFSRTIANNHGGSLALCRDKVNTCFRLILPVYGNRLNENEAREWMATEP